MEDEWNQSQGLEDQERLTRHLVRNAKKNPPITAKELLKRVAMASQDNNTTYCQSCQNESSQHKIKCLKYAKENLAKPKAF